MSFKSLIDTHCRRKPKPRPKHPQTEHTERTADQVKGRERKRRKNNKSYQFQANTAAVLEILWSKIAGTQLDATVSNPERTTAKKTPESNKENECELDKENAKKTTKILIHYQPSLTRNKEERNTNQGLPNTKQQPTKQKTKIT